MVLKDLKSDKHSSRRKHVAANASRMAQRQQQEAVVTSNAYRYEREEIDPAGDDCNILEEIAAKGVETNTDGKLATETTIGGSLGLEYIPSDERKISIGCGLLGLTSSYLRELMIDAKK